MNTTIKVPFDYGKAICYSGFRRDQQPNVSYPSYEEVLEDLTMLQSDWEYLRLYDCDPHSETVLEVIEKEKLNFKVMLGAYIVAEENNPNCPWDGGIYPQEQLHNHRLFNEKRVRKLAALANRYAHTINSLSVGNEACVDWTDHLVSVDRVIELAAFVQGHASQPVTFCENYAPWLDKLIPLGKQLDFISIHTYPVWEYKSIEEGLNYTKQNYYAVAEKYPDKSVVITEAGWPTNSNGRGIDPRYVNEAHQRRYFDELMAWIDGEKIVTYFFEAFDEPWKGSSDPMEPEKHWGLYHVDRSPKLAMLTSPVSV